MKRFFIAVVFGGCFFTLLAAEQWDFFPESVKTIAIVAPGKPAARKSADKAIAFLRAAGYKVKIMPHARLYEAPSPGSKVPIEKRVSDLMQAWFDPEVDLIWCMRGGNYSHEFARRLDYQAMRKRPMILVGFSNISALQQTLMKNQVGRIFSGPSVTSMLRTDAASRAWFKKALAGGRMPPIKLTALRAGKCSGQATGGHIVTLYYAVKNQNAVSAQGRIVFLETNESRPENIASVLNRLIALDYFTGCQGVVFGEFNNVTKAQQLEVMKDFTSKVSCPVYYGYPYGHGTANFLIDMERAKTIGPDGYLRQ